MACGGTATDGHCAVASPVAPSEAQRPTTYAVCATRSVKPMPRRLIALSSPCAPWRPHRRRRWWCWSDRRLLGGANLGRVGLAAAPRPAYARRDYRPANIAARDAADIPNHRPHLALSEMPCDADAVDQFRVETVEQFTRGRVGHVASRDVSEAE